MDNFKWDDELVKESVHSWHNNSSHIGFVKHLEEFKKSKQLETAKIFTTEDGVDLIHMSLVFILNTDIWMIDIGYVSHDILNGAMDKKFKYFSKKGIAEQYVLFNKPVSVSYKELLDILKANLSPTPYTNIIILHMILKFFKEKIKQY